jgi:hypothetical protein
MAFEDELLQLWQETVNSRYLYRGMSAKDLTDPLDPACDRFDGMAPGILELMEVLQGLVDDGFEFQLGEEHFGKVWWHDLGDIIRWTRHDFEHTGIDFTSLHQAAREYADCFQGSQLKQNLKYITDYLPERKDDPVVTSRMGEKEWVLVSRINAWLATESPDHRGVVIWVRRSCPVFEATHRFMPVGPFEHFREQALRTAREEGLPESIESVEKLLPDEARGFDFRLRRYLDLVYVERIEEVTPTRGVSR